MESQVLSTVRRPEFDRRCQWPRIMRLERRRPDYVVQGDYDGDGKTDVAIWRPNGDPTQNFFYTLGSTAGLGRFEWGATGDYPVANL